MLKLEKNNSCIINYNNTPCIIYVKEEGESIVLNCYINKKYNELWTELKNNAIAKQIINLTE